MLIRKSNRKRPTFKANLIKLLSWSITLTPWLLVVSLGYYYSNNCSSSKDNKVGILPSSPSGTNSVTQMKQQVPILGTVSDEIEEGLTTNGVPYFHCSGKQHNKNAEKVTIILLHGAKYNKEEWVSSRVLEKLCHQRVSSSKYYSAWALDLHYSSDHYQLKDVLDAMSSLEAGGLNTQIELPVDTIVTPSASGKTIVGWFTTDVTELELYVKKWIPIAPPPVSQTSAEHLQILNDSNIKVLAIHGDEDANGAKVSDKLGTHCKKNTQVIEMSGTHPCYLDNPHDFVKHVNDFLL